MEENGFIVNIKLQQWTWNLSPCHLIQSLIFKDGGIPSITMSMDVTDQVQCTMLSSAVDAPFAE